MALKSLRTWSAVGLEGSELNTAPANVAPGYSSVAYMRGEELGVFTHGHARPINPPFGDDPRWPETLEYLRGHYGTDSFDWTEVVYYRVEPTWMVAYSADPASITAATASISTS